MSHSFVTVLSLRRATFGGAGAGLTRLHIIDVSGKVGLAFGFQRNTIPNLSLKI